MSLMQFSHLLTFGFQILVLCLTWVGISGPVVSNKIYRLQPFYCNIINHSTAQPKTKSTLVLIFVDVGHRHSISQIFTEYTDTYIYINVTGLF